MKKEIEKSKREEENGERKINLLISETDSSLVAVSNYRDGQSSLSRQSLISESVQTSSHSS